MELPRIRRSIYRISIHAIGSVGISIRVNASSEHSIAQQQTRVENKTDVVQLRFFLAFQSHLQSDCHLDCLGNRWLMWNEFAERPWPGILFQSRSGHQGRFLAWNTSRTPQFVILRTRALSFAKVRSPESDGSKQSYLQLVPGGGGLVVGWVQKGRCDASRFTACEEPGERSTCITDRTHWPGQNSDNGFVWWLVALNDYDLLKLIYPESVKSIWSLLLYMAVHRDIDSDYIKYLYGVLRTPYFIYWICNYKSFDSIY